MNATSLCWYTWQITSWWMLMVSPGYWLSNSGFHEFAKTVDRSRFAPRKGRNVHMNAPLAAVSEADLHGTGRAEQDGCVFEQTRRRMFTHGLRCRMVSFCLWTQKYYCLTSATAISLKKKKGSCSCWEMLAFICCYLSNSAWSLLQLTRQQPLGKQAVINANQFLFVHKLSLTRQGISPSSDTPMNDFCISLQTHLLSAPEGTPIWTGSNGTVVCCFWLSGFIQFWMKILPTIRFSGEVIHKHFPTFVSNVSFPSLFPHMEGLRKVRQCSKAAEGSSDLCRAEPVPAESLTFIQDESPRIRTPSTSAEDRE